MVLSTLLKPVKRRGKDKKNCLIFLDNIIVQLQTSIYVRCEMCLSTHDTSKKAPLGILIKTERFKTQ